MWDKIKKNWKALVAVLVAIAAFFAGRRSAIGTARDFDKLRADNAELKRQIASLRDKYAKLVNLNKLNEQQLADLARQLGVAENIVEQSESIDQGNAEDIERLRENNERLGEWIRKYGAQIQGL